MSVRGLASGRGMSLLRISLIVVVGNSGIIISITFFLSSKVNGSLNRSELVTGCRPFLTDMRCTDVSNGIPGRGVEVVEAIVEMFPIFRFHVLPSVDGALFSRPRDEFAASQAAFEDGFLHAESSR